MVGKLEGKIALITGGSTGIGLTTAQLFVEEGAFVFITGRRQNELDEAVKVIGKNIVGVRGDVAKNEDLDLTRENSILCLLTLALANLHLWRVQLKKIFILF